MIRGQNLPMPLKNVSFGQTQARILNYSSTEIFCISPSLSPGLYDLLIPTINYEIAR